MTSRPKPRLFMYCQVSIKCPHRLCLGCCSYSKHADHQMASDLPLIITKAGDGSFFSWILKSLRDEFCPCVFFICEPYSADIDTETAARSWCDIDMSVHRPFAADCVTHESCSSCRLSGCSKGKSQDMVSEVAVLIIFESKVQKKKAPCSKMNT